MLYNVEYLILLQKKYLKPSLSLSQRNISSIASPRSIIAAGVQTKWFCCIRGISQVIGQANKDFPIEASRYLAASDFSTSPHSPEAFFFELPLRITLATPFVERRRTRHDLFPTVLTANA